MSRSRNKVIGITLGDPAGIGAEVVAKSLAKPSVRKLADFCIIGSRDVFRRYNRRTYSNCSFLDIADRSLKNIKPGHPNKTTAKASIEYLKVAVKLLKSGQISSLVTAPVCKEAIETLGQKFHGHTEFLANAFKCKNYGMMFVSPKMRTIIVTRHIPVNRVSSAINTTNIYQTISLSDTALRKTFHINSPRIAVCGLNPHAGEGGTIGKEEITKIIPAIKKARSQGKNIYGPFAADTLFSPDIDKRYDAIVAMYHDQGLIPIKTLCFKDLVNLTVGLPFIRTSPAHGTAFDIAGKNKADPSSMSAAIKLSAQLS